MELTIEGQKFRFYTRMHLTELTGVTASDVRELLLCVKSINGSSIYHHTHRSLQQHEYLNPEPANDFAYWVSNTLGENRLAEDLASIDTIKYNTIKGLREAIVDVLTSYLETIHNQELRKAKPGSEFCFMKSVSFVFPTHNVASNLAEFVDGIRKITADSLYFHMFESRLRLDKEENDFSLWLRKSLGLETAANDINRLDPYTHTVEQLKKAIIDILSGSVR